MDFLKYIFVDGYAHIFRVIGAVFEASGDIISDTWEMVGHCFMCLFMLIAQLFWFTIMVGSFGTMDHEFYGDELWEGIKGTVLFFYYFPKLLVETVGLLLFVVLGAAIHLCVLWVPSALVIAGVAIVVSVMATLFFGTLAVALVVGVLIFVIGAIVSFFVSLWLNVYANGASIGEGLQDKQLG